MVCLISFHCLLWYFHGMLLNTWALGLGWPALEAVSPVPSKARHCHSERQEGSWQGKYSCLIFGCVNLAQWDYMISLLSAYISLGCWSSELGFFHVSKEFKQCFSWAPLRWPSHNAYLYSDLTETKWDKSLSRSQLFWEPESCPVSVTTWLQESAMTT